MDALLHEVAERGIDQPLPLDPRLAGKGRAFDLEAEMAFAGRVVAAVAAMGFAVVGELEQGRASACSSRRCISAATGPVRSWFIAAYI